MIIQVDANDIEVFRKYLSLPHLDIHIHSDLGSQINEHSKIIHAHLLEVKKRYPHSLASSISHTKGLGGFCYVTNQSSASIGIGLDIEESARVRPEIIHRVRFNDEEINQMPSAGSLWTAKESVFKSLRGETQPIVVTSLHIGSWKRISSHIETFELINKSEFKVLTGLGMILQKNDYQIAIFCCELNYST